MLSLVEFIARNRNRQAERDLQINQGFSDFLVDSGEAPSSHRDIVKPVLPRSDIKKIFSSRGLTR